ncbi:MAG: hypothetical protein PHE53_00410 [Thermoguttaceae bacterium]|nr:hypothetical protein [Thermoguttaceae bacterium]
MKELHYLVVGALSPLISLIGFLCPQDAWNLLDESFPSTEHHCSKGGERDGFAQDAANMGRDSRTAVNASVPEKYRSISHGSRS